MLCLFGSVLLCPRMPKVVEMLLLLLLRCCSCCLGMNLLWCLWEKNSCGHSITMYSECIPAHVCVCIRTPRKTNIPHPKMMVGRLFSFWNGPFSGHMLIFGRVSRIPDGPIGVWSMPFRECTLEDSSEEDTDQGDSMGGVDGRIPLKSRLSLWSVRLFKDVIILVMTGILDGRISKLIENKKKQNNC